VVVFLIWLSWNVNAVFFGGALATEMEIAMEAGHTPLLADLRGDTPRALSDQASSPDPVKRALNSKV
jgi:membrane protein